MGFSRQGYWSGLPFPSPGDLPNPGIEPGSLALQTDALPSEPPGKAPTNNAEEAEVEWFYEDLQDLLELTHQKRCPFHYRGLECKSRKSRNTWSNRQIWPWNTEWSRAKANRVLPREWTGHSKHFLPITQEMTLHMNITDGQYWNQTDYILCSQRWRGSIQTAKTRPGADYGSDHELLIAKFRPKLKKVGKTTRPFKYDLNQISYDYTVEVTDWRDSIW